MIKQTKNQELKRDLKKIIDEYVDLNPAINNPKLSKEETDSGNEWGTWQVSVRRQNDCLVANGYILVGDSHGCQNHSTLEVLVRP